MKIVKASNGKTRITLSKKEWKEMGRTAGWMKIKTSGYLTEDMSVEEMCKILVRLHEKQKRNSEQLTERAIKEEEIYGADPNYPGYFGSSDIDDPANTENDIISAKHSIRARIAELTNGLIPF